MEVVIALSSPRGCGIGRDRSGLEEQVPRLMPVTKP